MRNTLLAAFGAAALVCSFACATPSGPSRGRGEEGPAEASGQAAPLQWKARCELGLAGDCRKLGRSRLCFANIPSVRVVAISGAAAMRGHEAREEEPIGGPDVGVSSTGQGDELLAEGQILDQEVASGEHGRADRWQEAVKLKRRRSSLKFRAPPSEIRR